MFQVSSIYSTAVVGTVAVLLYGNYCTPVMFLCCCSANTRLSVTFAVPVRSYCSCIVVIDTQVVIYSVTKIVLW